MKQSDATYEIEIKAGFPRAMYQLAKEMLSRSRKHFAQAAIAVGLQMRYAALAVVCAFTSLESYINGYGAERLNPEVWRECRRLRPATKWILVPQLATGQTFNKETEPFQSFIWLRNLRNYVLHFREGTYTMTGFVGGAHPAYSTFEPYSRLNIESAERACSTVMAMISALHALDDSEPPCWVLTKDQG